MSQEIANLRNQVVDRLTLLEAKTRQILKHPKGLVEGASRELAREILRLIPIAQDKEKSGQDPALEVSQIRELHRRVTKLVTAPLVEQGIRFRQGKHPGHVAWHAVVRGLVEQGLSFPLVWARLRHLAKQDHDVIVEVVTTNDDRACDEIPGQRNCPPGHHLHWRDHNERLRPVGAGTVKNFVSSLRHRGSK